MMTFQDLILKLNNYWAAQGCILMQPYDLEVGAGTMHPATVLKSLGPKPWKAAYIQPSRRPADGRYTKNPMRNQRYFQYQVLLKPNPENVVELYLGSLEALGLDLKKNDVRFVEDDWENPSLGAAGLGWEVWLNGTEISQFTYFQQMGGIECKPVCAEITYGPERLCLLLNKQYSFWTDLRWNENTSYKTVNWDLEMQHNVYNFEIASIKTLKTLFNLFEEESKRIISVPVYWDANQNILTTHLEPQSDQKSYALVYPALDFALKCSHAFNVLDARGAVSNTERAAYINRVRVLVKSCCIKYVDQLNFV